MVLEQLWFRLPMIHVIGNLQKKYDLPIIPVIAGGDVEKEVYTGEGEYINSDFLNGLTKEEAIETMINWLKEHGVGDKK